MFHDKRRHKRFEVFIVVEIKSIKAPTNYIIGITRDFSFEGFSFESQSRDLEVGEDIEFKFKHPQDNTYVFESGNIVWKQSDNKFDCFMGVKFKEIDKAAKTKLLEIASFAGNIPDYSFLSDKGDKDIHVEETEVNDDLFADEPETTGPGEDADGETFELDTEGVDGSWLPIDSGQAAYDDNFSEKKEQRKKILLYISIAIVAAVALFLIFENSNKILKRPIPVSTGSGSHEDIDRKEPVPVVVDVQTDNIEYYIQVGAWKHPEYALETLAKLKPYYPEAYITVENDFHKLRIPGIINKRQGANISKVIEAKFDLKPILVRKTK